jgi:hypothetical protein
MTFYQHTDKFKVVTNFCYHILVMRVISDCLTP